MKSSELAPLLFTVYLAAASGRSPALPCFAAFLALVRFSGLFAFTQLFFQTPGKQKIPLDYAEYGLIITKGNNLRKGCVYSFLMLAGNYSHYLKGT